MTEVVLEYKRVDMQSSGRILIRDGEEDALFFDFDQLDFEPMLYKFAEALQDNPDASGVIHRTDRAGLQPYTLDHGIITLFRTDPIAAVKSMSTPYGSPSGIVKRVKQQSKEPDCTTDLPYPFVGLRVGFNTMADAFGEELSSRFDKSRDRIECPCCGIWNQRVIHGGSGHHYIECKNPSCALHGKPIYAKNQNDHWASFSTFELLATHSDRFYFPRPWNDGKAWISWEGLNNKYQQFVKEKESCP